jgi:hypothetical protein
VYAVVGSLIIGAINGLLSGGFGGRMVHEV